MGLLDRFEDRIDRAVNGAFARAFKAEVQPVEVAAALQREMDDRAAIIAKGRTVVPNGFVVDLSTHDHERLSVYGDALRAELATMVGEYAAEQRYTLVGQVSIDLDLDDDLDTGIFRVRSEAKADVTSMPLAGQPNSPGAARLLVDGTVYPLVRAVTRIGRGADVDIRVDDPGASRSHCEIVLGSPAIVRDLASTNGTFVDGKQVSEAVLVDGSELRIGSTLLVYRSV